MGIGFVLLFWAVVGTVLAAGATLVLSLIAGALIPKDYSERKALLSQVKRFPLICLIWMFIVFCFQGAVNEVLLKRDCGLGDGWQCPMSNGYEILMIDDTDHGYVYNPKTQAFGGVGEQEDAVSGVTVMQVAGTRIFGRKKAPDSYFVLDTVSGKTTKFSDPKTVEKAADELGTKLKLEPIATVYYQNRYTWFDLFAVLLLFAPPLILIALFYRKILRARKMQ